jgi:HD superfamily phosphodiesterase
MDTCVELIREAEGKWIPPITSFVVEQFRSVHLPSHDFSHHQRVWQYARELLQLLSAIQPVDRVLVENTIIAAFFHDLGLTKTTSKEHGRQSRLICEDFFAAHPILGYRQLTDALNAIEQHDDKDYASAVLLRGTTPLDLLTIVHMADDLDAFGSIGVFRYAEIYLLRGVSVAEMPDIVITNLETRFRHLAHAFHLLPSLSEKHSRRYLATKKFYQDFTDFDRESGPAHMVELFRTYILVRKMSLEQFISRGPTLSMDAYGKEYLSALTLELKQFE